MVKPRVIILENVEEFQQWGPLTKEGRPDPKQKGRTFNSFVNALRYQGYTVEWRELRACDYGTPTIRKRLFLIARCDGAAIVWPEVTHGDASNPRVLAGELLPQRTAAECIDWDLPLPSIFDRVKPLVKNTLNRVAQGQRRYVLEALEPFIVTCNHSGERFRGQGVNEPFLTVTSAYDAHGLVDPLLAPCVVNKQHRNRARSPLEPLSTVTTNHNKNEIVAAQLVTYYGVKKAGEGRGQPMTEPIRTQTTENRFALVGASLVPHGAQQTAGVSLTRAVHMMQDNGGKLPPADASFSVARPGRTVLARGGRQNVVGGTLLKIDNQRSWGSGVYATTSALPTIVTKNSYALASAHLSAVGGSQSSPQGAGGITVRCAYPLTGAALARAREVCAFLVEYLGETVMAPYVQGGLVVLKVRGAWYVMADIGMRMLTPRELARCQGFPDTYILDTDSDGKKVSKARQVAGIGNSVCIEPAAALTLANLGLPLSEAAD